jgi:hypothetical protein
MAFNADYREAHVKLPEGTRWRLIVNTKEGWDEHYFKSDGRELNGTIELAPHSTLVAKEIGALV